METNKHNSLDDIVFENKNKAYGAYYNRITAGFDLMKSLFITIFGIGIMALVLSFTFNKVEKPVIEKERYVIYIPTEIAPEKDEPIKEDEPIKKANVVVDNKTEITPTPNDDPENQTEMRDNEDLSTVASGDVPSEGDDSGIKTPENSGQSGGNEDGGNETPEQPEKTVFSPRDVTEMAIFPGCEKFAGNKTKLQTCLSEQLQNELSGQLSDFEVTAHREGINEATARVQFIIDKSGKIIDVKTLNGGNMELSKESKQALERISKRMIQKGKYIQPAKFNDGTPVNLMFTIPVKFTTK